MRPDGFRFQQGQSFELLSSAQRLVVRDLRSGRSGCGIGRRHACDADGLERVARPLRDAGGIAIASASPGPDA